MYWCCHHSSCSPGQQRSLPRVITKNLTAQGSNFPSSAKKKSPRSHCSCGKPRKATKNAQHRALQTQVKRPRPSAMTGSTCASGVEIGGYWGDAIGHPWCKETTLIRRPWCWESLRGQEEKGTMGSRDGRMDMSSLTQCTWVWTNSRRWWTGKPAYCSPWGHKRSDTPEWLNEKGEGKAAPSRVSPSIAVAVPSPRKEGPLELHPRQSESAWRPTAASRGLCISGRDKAGSVSGRNVLSLWNRL